jgi:hypothetical protein
MGDEEDAYEGKVRWLQRMQKFHWFYFYRGVAVSSLLIFVAVIVAVQLDKHGGSRSANALFSAVLISCLFALILFFVNLVILYRWQCPRCGTETMGWVTKEAECFRCGLPFRTDNEITPS